MRRAEVQLTSAFFVRTPILILVMGAFKSRIVRPGDNGGRGEISGHLVEEIRDCLMPPWG